jgi:hypothetical protein
MDTSMVGGPEHPVVCIEVLVHRDLEHSGGTLTRHGIKQLMYAEDKKGTHRLAIVDQAKKNAQVLNHLSPYFATIASLLDNQFRYHRQIVAE